MTFYASVGVVNKYRERKVDVYFENFHTHTNASDVESQSWRKRREREGEIKRVVLVAPCNASLYYVLIKRNKIFQRSIPRRIHHGSMCFMLVFFFYFLPKSWPLQSNIFCVFFSNCLRSWGLWYWSVMVETSSSLSHSLRSSLSGPSCVLVKLRNCRGKKKDEECCWLGPTNLTTVICCTDDSRDRSSCLLAWLCLNKVHIGGIHSRASLLAYFISLPSHTLSLSLSGTHSVIGFQPSS